MLPSTRLAFALIPAAGDRRVLQGSGAGGSGTFLSALLVFLIALVVRLLGASSVPLGNDEIYSILAARSYLAEGTFRIWQGEYVRASDFTVLVAWSIATFGDTLLAARIPSIVSGALLVAAAFLWLYRSAGAAAAWILAFLFGFASFAITISHFARFYALHGLLVWIGAVAIYGFVARPARPSGYLLLALGAVALVAAYRLQVTTLIAVVALAIWAACDAAFRPAIRRVLATRRATIVLIALTIALATVVALPGPLREQLARLYGEYRWVPMWDAASQHYPRYYLHQFAELMPVLFYLFPVALLVAVAGAPRPAIFCVTVTAAVVGLHSFGGMKGMRFVYYTLPLIFAIWAIAAVTLVPALYRAGLNGIARVRELSRSTQPLAGNRYAPIAAATDTRLARAIATLLVSAAILFALVGNPMYDTLKQLPRTIASDLTRMAAGDTATQASVERQRAALLTFVGAGVLATSNELRALYHLGRYDVLLRPTRLSEVAPGREFARDPRTGGPVISTSESLRRVVECYPRGSMLVWGNDWGLPYAINADLAHAIATSMQEVAVPGPLEVRAFRWQHEPSGDAGCAAVRDALTARPRAATGAGLTKSARTLSSEGGYHNGRAGGSTVPRVEPTAISLEPHENA